MSKIPFVVAESMKNAGVSFEDIDGFAVTYGPGLAGSLIVGVSYAKALALSNNKKFIGINHLEAHLLTPFLEYQDFDFPFIGIVVSGGHTNIYLAKSFGNYKLVGSTRDDAAGEAFDKIAKMLGLPYPGGPELSKAAKQGVEGKIVFPQAVLKDHSMDFSFSGLKTAVLQFVQKNKDKIDAGEITVGDIAAAAQKAIVRALVNKLKKVQAANKITRIAVTGGVAANTMLKNEIVKMAEERNIKAFVPSPILCTDNAGMIAYVGWRYLKEGKGSAYDIEAEPALKL